MTIKRVAKITATFLILIGMAVSASEGFRSTAEECTNVPIVCEVLKPDVATKPIPAADEGIFELMKTMEYIPPTPDEITRKIEPQVQRISLIELANEVEEKEVVEEAEKVEETQPAATEKPAEEVETEKPEVTVKPLEEGTIIDPNMDESEIVLEEYVWDGEVINSYNGTVAGPNGKETYYNLNMSGVVKIMESLGYDYEYWVREDGAKMYGPFIMVAADLSLRPRGSIIKTSLGWAMVCDTGEFVNWNPTQLDIAVSW